MPVYRLDTDICSYVMKRSSPALLERLARAPVPDVCMSDELSRVQGLALESWAS